MSCRCVLVGDGVTENAKFCIFAVSNSGSEEYVTTCFDNYYHCIVRKGTEYTLQLWDMAGQEDYHRLQVLSYPQTGVFLFFFSVVNPPSFENLVRKWIPEVATHCPYAGRVLVGVDKKLRIDESTLQSLQNRGMRSVTEFQVLELVHSIDAQSYGGCDSITQENIVVPFQQVSLRGILKYSGT
ncbi:complex between Cdc42hs.Gmppnp and P50 Rhogap [Acephala macrosclerotiorum]|nr:complex between Cdc42hs.Gmppnp and P50 Rhogap [Acephala macrosclerotiorum]